MKKSLFIKNENSIRKRKDFSRDHHKIYRQSLKIENQNDFVNKISETVLSIPRRSKKVHSVPGYHHRNILYVSSPTKSMVSVMKKI